MQPWINKSGDKEIKIFCLSGLGFSTDHEVSITKETNNLIFRGKELKEWEEEITSSIKQQKHELVDKTIKIDISIIKGLEMLDESGRSLGKAALYGIGGSLLLGPVGFIAGGVLGGRKRYTSYIIFQVKTENIQYQIILGGTKQKDVRAKYNRLLSLLNSN